MFSSSSLPSPPTAFQTYILPSIPFRRRKSSVSTASSSTPRHGSSASDSVATSPLTPISPLAPTEHSFFNLHSRSLSRDYEFNCPQGQPDSFGRQRGSHAFDSALQASSFSPTKPSYLSGHTSHISCARCHADLALTSQIISKGFTGRHGRAYLVAPSTSSLTCTPCTSPGGVGSPSLPNTHTHKPVPRHLVTGLHTVSDITCAVCDQVLGWKYVSAEEETQRYKVGKFILETRRCTVGSRWENAVDEDNEGDMDGWWGGMDGVDTASTKGHSRRKSSLSQSAPHSGNAAGGRSLASRVSRTLIYDDSDDEIESLDGREHSKDDDEEEEIMFDSQDEDECEDLFAGIWSPALAKRRRARRGLVGR